MLAILSKLLHFSMETAPCAPPHLRAAVLERHGAFERVEIRCEHEVTLARKCQVIPGAPPLESSTTDFQMFTHGIVR